jgi:hypothetical protein
MQNDCLNELEDLIKDFLMYADQWFEKGIIDEDTYTEIKNKKVKFIKDINDKKV